MARLNGRRSPIASPKAHSRDTARFVTPVVTLEIVASCPTSPAAIDASERRISTTNPVLTYGEPSEIPVYLGPDPYVDYDRRFTPEDGIAITYKTVDESTWRIVFRSLVLLAVIALAAAYLAKASPYPMLPHGCPVFGPCPFTMRWDRYWVDVVLLIGFSGLSAWILFAEVQVYREIEIRADCMILDGEGIYWPEKFDLGWPQFVPREDGMHVLAAVYGTRWTEFLKVKAFDENDRGPAVFAAHLASAMQQQWGGAID